MANPELSKEVDIAFRFASTIVHERNQEYLNVEHLLLGLLHDEKTCRILRYLDVDIEQSRQELERFIAEEIPSLPPEQLVEFILSWGCQQMINMAFLNASSSERNTVEGLHLLISLFNLEDSFGRNLLEAQGVDKLALMRVSSVIKGEGLDALDEDDDDADELDDRLSEDEEAENPFSLADRGDGDDEEADEEDEEGERGSSDSKVLKRYVVDLSTEAEEGRLDPMIGRQKELERAVHVLSRRRKNNPVFVGEAGVGKTAIAEGLANAIHMGEVPEQLSEARLYSLDVGSLIAGTRYRGDFEQRIKRVLKAIRRIPGAILFIDEIHTLIGAGATTGGTMDASSLLKPMLARGELRCIGATTWKEYRNVFERDQAFARRFQKIDVSEPSVEESAEILKGLAASYEDFHGVTYLPEVFSEAAKLASRHLQDRRLPDTAIDLIDEAGAGVKLRGGTEVTVEEIEQTIAKMAGIPPRQVSSDDRDRLRDLGKQLRERIFGQDEAVDQLSAAVKLSRAGLGAPEQPIGAFLFSGPTGVGKTEVARQLAQLLGLELLRFDMSEYMERHTVSRLIGAPPGYVGFDQGGLLTEAISKNPHSVLLLDEIEKAHPEVFNLLLQVMDHGTLTDNNGKKADFRNVILIMTSNVGATELQRRRPGFFANDSDRSGDDDESFKRAFSPEFRNRLHARIRFAPLGESVTVKIAAKIARELCEQLSAREVEAGFSEAALTHLAKIGHDPLNGARPMQRILRTEVKQALADELLFGALAEGGQLWVDAKEGGFVFSFNEEAQTQLERAQGEPPEGGSRAPAAEASPAAESPPAEPPPAALPSEEAPPAGGASAKEDERET